MLATRSELRPVTLISSSRYKQLNMLILHIHCIYHVLVTYWYWI